MVRSRRATAMRMSFPGFPSAFFGFVGDDQVLHAQAVAEKGDARGVERGGGFHVDRVASYARDLTDELIVAAAARHTRESRAPVGSRRMLDRLSELAFVAKTLLRLGMVQPERPDRLLRALDALRRRGPTVAGRLRGRRAAAARGHCGDRRARLADLRRDRPHERPRPRAGRPRRRGGRRRRDHCPQPPRLRRGLGRVARSSGPTRSTSTPCSPGPSSRTWSAGEPRALIFDEEFSAARQRMRCSRRSASSPGPTARRSTGPDARGADRGATRSRWSPRPRSARR